MKFVMEQEGEKQDRALAKCYGMWDQHKAMHEAPQGPEATGTKDQGEKRLEESARLDKPLLFS